VADRTPPGADRTPPGLNQSPKRGRGLAWIFAGIALVIVLVGIVISSFAEDDPYDPNNRLEVIAQCEARIEEQLKAPTTAEFDSTATGDGTWTVTGTVDAENSFGANVRSEYQCTVKVTGDDTLSTKIDYID
jgi:hypothetical protein